MSDLIVYEYPMNERLRQFLRLERTFLRIEHHKRMDTIWDTQACIQLILELAVYSNRGNFKNEIIKEVERQHLALKNLGDVPHVNQASLAEIMSKQKSLIDGLYSEDGRSSANIHNDEMLSAVSNRMLVPGGGCDFDLPPYHHWLHLPKDAREHQIDHWLKPYKAIRDSIMLLLEMTRNSGIPTQLVVENGAYQHIIESPQKILMIRMHLDKSLNCYPEVSVGKQRFNLLFYTVNTAYSKRCPISTDINLTITLCDF